VATHGLNGDEQILLFNGALDYAPNFEAVKIITDKINPELLATSSFKYKIIICGRGLPASLNNLEAYRDKNIIYTGFVPDIEMYVKGADLFI